MKERKPNFELGETHKFFNARFNRWFEDTKQDTFRPDNARRCVDKFGDVGWVVGFSRPIELDRKLVGGWNWVLRDRDHALVGIKDCNLTIDQKDFKKDYPKNKSHK